MMVLAQEFHENLIRYYLDQLASPAGALFIVIALLLAVSVLALEEMRWAVLAVGTYLASYSYERLSVNATPLPPPFSYLVQFSQLVTLATLALLCIAVLRPVPWVRHRLVHPALICFFLIQIIMASRLVIGGYATKGMVSLAIFSANFLILGVGVSRWLHDETHVRKLVKAMSWTAGLMVLCSFLLFLLRFDSAFLAGRLVGTSENPQRTALLLAMGIPFACAIMVDQGSTKPARVTHALIAGFTAIFLLMTSSRAGALTAVIGLIIFFRRRIGPFVIAAFIFVAVGLVIATAYESAFDLATSHLTRTNDSRTRIWLLQISTFMESPFIGVSSGTVLGENSYLAIAAGGGIVALLPLFLMLIFMARTAWILNKSSRSMEGYSPFVDATCAAVAQLFVAWIFEGAMLGLITDHVFTIYLVLALMTFLSERRTSMAASEEALQRDHGSRSGKLFGDQALPI